MELTEEHYKDLGLKFGPKLNLMKMIASLKKNVVLNLRFEDKLIFFEG